MDLKVGVFHPGTQHSWQTALAFQESHELQWLLTSVYFKNSFIKKNYLRYLPNGLQVKLNREIGRRNFSLLDDSHVKISGVCEWLEILFQRAGYRAIASDIDKYGNQNFYKNVLARIKKSEVNLLWGFNNSSLETFYHAKKLGIKCVLDQTIGHPSSYNSIIESNRKSHSNYFFDNISYAKDEWLLTRNTEEAELADIVVVGSEFCAETMLKSGCAESKIRIVPYGFDENLFKNFDFLPTVHTVVRFLFVGSVIPRKGIHYLIEAFKNISPDRATLTIVGGIGIPSSVISNLPNNVFVKGSVPRSEVVNFYRDADVFIFPSLFEGGGIVLYEAAAAGLAIVQTKACGDGVRADNGFVLNEVTTESLVEIINKMIDSPSLVQDMKKRSYEIRNERSWLKYRNDIRELASGIIK